MFSIFSIFPANRANLFCSVRTTLVLHIFAVRAPSELDLARRRDGARSTERSAESKPTVSSTVNYALWYLAIGKYQVADNPTHPTFHPIPHLRHPRYTSSLFESSLARCHCVAIEIMFSVV